MRFHRIRLFELRWSLGPVLFLLLGTGLQARTDDVAYDQQLAQGHDAVYRLDFATAERIFQDLMTEYPERPGAYAFLALTRWNQLLQAAGNLALDDYATPTPFARKPHKPVKAERQSFLEANQRAVEVCDRVLDREPENVRALYFKGLAHENLASEAVAIRKEPWEAWGYGRTATRLHRRVLELDPDFVDARLSLGVAEFAKATVPWSIRWFSALFFPGDKEHALASIREVAEKGRFRSRDAQIVLALLHAWKGDPQEAVRVFQRLRTAYPSNYLLDLNLAAIQMQNLNSPRQALETYQNLLANLDSKARTLRPGEVYYRLGLTFYRLNEYAGALNSFQQALASPTLEEETKPLSAYWIAQIHQAQGDPEKAADWYRQVLESGSELDTLTEELKIARRHSR